MLASGASIHGVQTLRASFTMDSALAEHAKRLGINVSAAAREGVESAVRAAMAASDREAYIRAPETGDAAWEQAEVWSSE